MIGAVIGSHPIAATTTESGSITSLAETLAGVSVYLVEIDVATGASNDDLEGGIGVFAIGSAPVGGHSGDPADGTTDTLRFSDCGYITKPTDDPANTLYESRAVNVGSINRPVILTPESGSSGAQSVEIEIDNSDGYLDGFIASNAVDGQDIAIKVGPANGAYADFLTVWKGQGVGWDNNGEVVRITARDSSYYLDVPIQTSLYAGTGTYEGTVDLAGRPKPLGFGRCENVLAILVDPTNLIFQVHGGAVNSFEDVFDQGLALTFQADTTDLYSGSTNSGEYRTDKSRGLFQLGATPTGTITCTFQGDATGSYVNTIPDIALRILKNHASVPDAYIDSGSFANLKAVAGGNGNYYVAEQRSARDAINEIMRGVGAYWYCQRDGRLRVQRLAEPDKSSYVLDLDENNVLAARRVSMPSTITPPHYRRTIGYNRNHLVQIGEDLAGSVTAARRQWLASEWRTTVATDVSVQTKHPLAQAPAMLDSNLDGKSDADSLASELLALHGADRQMIEVDLTADGQQCEMNDNVKLTWPRFGLQNAGFFRAFPIRENMRERTVTLLLWG